MTDSVRGKGQGLKGKGVNGFFPLFLGAIALVQQKATSAVERVRSDRISSAMSESVTPTHHSRSNLPTDVRVLLESSAPVAYRLDGTTSQCNA